jgi:hypothetical protein
MDDDVRQLVETYRAEALALFTVNQAGRAAAERVAALALTLVGVAVGIALNADTDVVLIPLSPLCLLLVSYMFQQYGEVTVTGAARSVLEDRLAALLSARALIYEHAVAPVRQRPPLVGSVRVLQTLTSLVIVGVVAWAAVVAAGQRWYVTAGFAVATALTLGSALLSYRDMLRSGREARRQIVAALDETEPRG